MKWTRNVFPAAVAAILIAASGAFGQVIKQVPSSAIFVLKVANLEATSTKVANFAGSLALTQMRPELADPLGWFLKDGIHGSAGVNRSGELAIVVLDPAVVGGNMQHAVLGLLPVSDYKAFLSNFPDAAPDGDFTVIHLHGDINPSYVAHWGDYAAVSDSKQCLQTPTSFLTVQGLSAKELDSKDFIIYANLKQLRTKALSEIEKGRHMMLAEINKQANHAPTTRKDDPSKFLPVLKIAGNEFFDGCKRFMLDADSATFGLNIGPDGISTTSLLEFQPDSYMASLVAGVKNTDATMLTGLPDGKYLVYGGAQWDNKQVSDLLNQITAPLEKPIADLGPDYASAQDMISIIKAAVAAQNGTSIGLIAPTGALGQEAMIQMINIRTGDSKMILDSSHKMIAAQLALTKELGLDAAGATKTTLTANAKTLAGVSFDEIQTVMDPTSQNQMQQQMMQMMAFLYGPGGMTMYAGAVNDKSVLTTSGLSDVIMTAAINAIKTSDDPLGRQPVVKAVAEQLPAKRAVAIYIPLDIWATTGLNYARMFSMDFGVRIPDDLPPVGITVSTQESAVRCDSFISAQLIQQLTSAGLQIYVASHQPATQPSGQGGGL